MKCKMYLLALSAMALATGCSNDETIDLNKGNAINFSVTASKPTRAAATTTDNIKEFKVWAQIGEGEQNGKTYMDGVEVKRNTNNDKWEYSGTKFWPEVKLNFFAYSPINPAHLTHVTGKPFVFNYEVPTNGDEDFLYATNRDETKANHKTTPVNINFRHALSQIVFNAKLTATSTIDVEIKDIKIEGIANKAVFTHPTALTTAPYQAGNTDTETDESWATWTNIAGEASYNVKDDVAKKLSTTAAQMGENLFLLPQTLAPWLTIDATTKKAKVTGSARLLVNCKIKDKASGLQLWPKTAGEYANVAVSLDNPKNDPKREPDATGKDTKHDKWMQGKKYTYTLIFGEGGGYTPDPENPEPVLVPITFKVTVDEFQDGGNYDLPANNPA